MTFETSYSRLFKNFFFLNETRTFKRETEDICLKIKFFFFFNFSGGIGRFLKRTFGNVLFTIHKRPIPVCLKIETNVLFPPENV